MMEQITKNRELSILNNRLIKLMGEKNLNIHTLAQKAGIAIGTVQKLTSDPTCNPTISSLEAICKILGVPISYLIGQNENISRFSENFIPLLRWDTVIDDLSNLEAVKIQKTKENNFIYAAYDAEKTFALEMIGNSMFPLFPEGSILIFDKDKLQYDGGYALIYTYSSKKILFKQLLIDDPKLYFKSCNPAFKDSITQLTDQDKILAMLVMSQMQY